MGSFVVSPPAFVVPFICLDALLYLRLAMDRLADHLYFLLLWSLSVLMPFPSAAPLIFSIPNLMILPVQKRGVLM